MLARGRARFETGGLAAGALSIPGYGAAGPIRAADVGAIFETGDRARAARDAGDVGRWRAVRDRDAGAGGRNLAALAVHRASPRRRAQRRGRRRQSRMATPAGERGKRKLAAAASYRAWSGRCSPIRRSTARQ